jgi:hypothetical protein
LIDLGESQSIGDERAFGPDGEANPAKPATIAATRSIGEKMDRRKRSIFGYWAKVSS